MSNSPLEHPLFLPRARLNDLFQSLLDHGYRIMAPVVRDDSILYQQINSADALPHGIIDDRHNGSYQIAQAKTPRCFAWSNPQQSLKSFVFSPVEILWKSFYKDNELVFQAIKAEAQPTVIFGVKGCDIAGLQLLDQHFYHKKTPDTHYQQRRDNLILFGINCFRSGSQCFCTNTGDGPNISSPSDCIMSELDEGYIIHHVNSPLTEIIDTLQLKLATTAQQQQATYESSQAALSQQQKLPEITANSVFEQWSHPVWNDIADTCLGCGNCTTVCPSCFCHQESSDVSIDLTESSQTRSWDSCFTTQHSYLHGFYIRPERSQRYRQWLSHKFSGWQSQFGRIGCTGCGRCATYCPVGIDPTQVLQTLFKRRGEPA
ncbi:MAG: 4Fe-4S dicluster domain-containing protein [Methylococcales bacterium]|jgi:sulfhydrogenase subunit beta (sulfur reductase)|nr:4Fe-4S dicluster domain-containing protein [Methylococcales bacterium]MBT7410297.1 4Fe-4S dicluster domain-containing protein [Methylococcales bacterium]